MRILTGVASYTVINANEGMEASSVKSYEITAPSENWTNRDGMMVERSAHVWLTIIIFDTLFRTIFETSYTVRN